MDNLIFSQRKDYRASTVTNEGVKSVAVYSIAGSLVASSESNVINVANLVNGIYVVKANTEAGVITGQIIKK